MPKVRGVAINFLSSNFIKSGTVQAYQGNKPYGEPVTTDKNGEFEFADLPAGKTFSFRFQAPRFNPIHTGCITIPEKGIQSPDCYQNVTFQVPYEFLSLGMVLPQNGRFPKGGKSQCIGLTIRPPGKTMRHLPHGLPGAKCKITFHHPDVQARWEAKLKRQGEIEASNDRISRNANATAALAAAFAFYAKKNISTSVIAALLTKTIAKLLACKVLNEEEAQYYYDIGQKGLWANKTNPFIRSERMRETSADGGLLIYTQDLAIPEEGVEYTVEIEGPEGIRVSSMSGWAFPGVITNMSPPFSPTAETMPQNTLMSHEPSVPEDDRSKVLGLSAVAGIGAGMVARAATRAGISLASQSFLKSVPAPVRYLAGLPPAQSFGNSIANSAANSVGAALGYKVATAVWEQFEVDTSIEQRKIPGDAAPVAMVRRVSRL